MIDINGIELVVGDDVVYTNRNLNDLRIGKVTKITKTQVIIELTPTVKYQTTLPDGTIYKWKSTNNHIITGSSQIMKLG